MSDFSFLAVPNIEGMRVWWYIQIFGIAFFFGICLFFVIYFRRIYRRNKALIHQLDRFDHQSRELAHQLLHQKILKTSGKPKLILFIEYLEKFITNKPYANPSELLSSQWFTQPEIEECLKVLYTNHELSKHIAHRIDTYFIS